MTPALEAHLRLMSALPKRTHIAPDRNTRIEWGCKRTPEQQGAFEREVRALNAQGKTRTEICRTLHCQYSTLRKILGHSR